MPGRACTGRQSRAGQPTGLRGSAPLPAPRSVSGAWHSSLVDDGPSAYREWSAGARLAADVACLWAAVPDPADPRDALVLPDACIDVIWDGSSLFVAGPDTGPVPVPWRPGTMFAGLRFRPGRAPGFLGPPASELLDQRVTLADLWGRPAADALQERVQRAPDVRAAAAALAAAVEARAAIARPADPLVSSLVDGLQRGPESARVVREAARALGAGERRLHRRCCAAVGYGPKMLERVLRFRRAQRLAAAGSSLAAVAAEAGYADHAHLVRECRRLSGRAPSDLFKTASQLPA
jgi:AraC-like DNA-binding protein